MQAHKTDPKGPLGLENLEWRRPITKAKLTEEQAATIYKWSWGTSMTDKEVGQYFGVARQTVSDVKHERTWTHITDDITVDKS